MTVWTRVHIKTSLKRWWEEIGMLLNLKCISAVLCSKKGKWGFNVPFWHKPERFAKSYITKIVNQIGWVEDKIHSSNWEFRLWNFSEIIKQANHNDIIYCDPPYIARHSDYFNKWTEDDEKKSSGMKKIRGGNTVRKSASANGEKAHLKRSSAENASRR